LRIKEEMIQLRSNFVYRLNVIRGGTILLIALLFVSVFSGNRHCEESRLKQQDFQSASNATQAEHETAISSLSHDSQEILHVDSYHLCSFGCPFPQAMKFDVVFAWNETSINSILTPKLLFESLAPPSRPPLA
jgi:hypothetical protein